jgi:hypothetical protein
MSDLSFDETIMLGRFKTKGSEPGVTLAANVFLTFIGDPTAIKKTSETLATKGFVTVDEAGAVTLTEAGADKLKQ